MWFPDEKGGPAASSSQMTFVSACSLSSIALSSQSTRLLSVYHECPVQAGALRVFLRGGGEGQAATAFEDF